MVKGKLKTICFDGVIYTLLKEKDGKQHIVKMKLGNMIEFEMGRLTPIPLTEEFEVSNETLVGELRAKILNGLATATDEDKKESWQAIYDSLSEFPDNCPLSEVLETLVKRGYAQ